MDESDINERFEAHEARQGDSSSRNLNQEQAWFAPFPDEIEEAEWDA